MMVQNRDREHSSMKIASFVAAAALAAALPSMALAQADMPKAKVKAGFKVPRQSDGRPDLEGIWTNATTTRLERPANFGERLALTPQELSSTEQATRERNARQNKVTDKATFDNWKTEALKPDNSDE